MSAYFAPWVYYMQKSPWIQALSRHSRVVVSKKRKLVNPEVLKLELKTLFSLNAVFSLPTSCQPLPKRLLLAYGK
jgi:hypothetical protein